MQLYGPISQKKISANIIVLVQALMYMMSRKWSKRYGKF